MIQKVRLKNWSTISVSQRCCLFHHALCLYSSRFPCLNILAKVGAFHRDCLVFGDGKKMSFYAVKYYQIQLQRKMEQWVYMARVLQQGAAEMTTLSRAAPCQSGETQGGWREKIVIFFDLLSPEFSKLCFQFGSALKYTFSLSS